MRRSTGYCTSNNDQDGWLGFPKHNPARDAESLCFDYKTEAPAPIFCLRQPAQRPVAAVVGISESLEVVAEAVSQRQEQPVVRHALVLERAAHLEIEAVADHHPRDVVERVRVALAQLVRPEQQRVVEQAAIAA